MFAHQLDPVSMALDRIKTCDIDEELQKPVVLNQSPGPMDFDTMPWGAFDHKSRVRSIIDVHRAFNPVAESVIHRGWPPVY